MKSQKNNNLQVPRLLAISGSPHADGTCALMLGCAVSAAKAKGWHVDEIHLYGSRINYCLGCRTCLKTGSCVQDDDIRHIAGLLSNCDVVVLSAPTYWGNVPAVVKNMFDRLLGTAMQTSGSRLQPRLSKKQKYLLLTSCNTPFPFSMLSWQSRGSLHAMETFFRQTGMQALGRISADGMNKKTGLSPGIARKIKRYWK